MALESLPDDVIASDRVLCPWPVCTASSHPAGKDYLVAGEVIGRMCLRHSAEAADIQAEVLEAFMADVSEGWS